MNISWKKTGTGILLAGALTTGGVTVADKTIDPYTDKGTTLEIAKASTLANAGDIKSTVSKNEPKITLSKWSGDVALGVKYVGLPANSTGSRPLLSKNVEWSTAEETMQAVPLDASATMEDGGMEINLILKSAPASNAFVFALTGTENLDFFYQPPLTAKDIKEGAERPENVVGSYAVYYKTHNHIEGETNYATGKAFHIPRPLVSDAKNNTVWADLSYADGLLTVTVPQSFLDAATYPVVVDPTFGYTTQGASSQASDANGDAYGETNTGVAGTLTSISVYMKRSSATTVTSEYMVGNSTTISGNIADLTQADALTTSYQLFTKTASSQVLSGATQFVFISLGEGDTAVSIPFDSGSGLNGGQFNFPGGWTAVTTRDYSTYFTYTAPAAAAASNQIIINGGSIKVNGGSVIVK